MSRRNRSRRQRTPQPTPPRAASSAPPSFVGGRLSGRMRAVYVVLAVVLGVVIAGASLFAIIAPGDGDSSDAAPTSVAATAEPTRTAAAATATAATGAPPMTIDVGKTYDAVLRTEKGDIKIRLRPDLAPQHVNSFVTLARRGFYNGVTFHRVLDNFVAQGGDPTGTGTGGPGYTVPAEFSATPFDRGIVGAARSTDPNSAGSQFFITYARNASTAGLDRQYTVFGQVTEGMDVADRLTRRDPQRTPNAPPGDRILSVEIIES
jgi:peptidylprolyl isomerase